MIKIYIRGMIDLEEGVLLTINNVGEVMIHIVQVINIANTYDLSPLYIYLAIAN